MSRNYVAEAREIGERIIRWADDDRASAVILGSLSASLTKLCHDIAAASAPAESACLSLSTEGATNE